MTELRTRMIRDMTVRGFSPRTHDAYIGQVVQLARLSWFSVKMTAVGVLQRRARTSAIAAVMVREGPGASGVALAALAG